MRQGLLYAALCYSIWGLFPLYFKAIQTVSAMEILLHRVLWSMLFLLGVLTWRRQWTWLTTLRQQKKLIAGFAFSALLLSTNWFIYIWAVNNGRIVDSSLGYFMTPLVNVLLGLILLKERLRAMQWLAVALAAVGVAWLTLQTGQLPLISLSLAMTFGLYGLLRKTAQLGALEGLSLETLLLFPFALSYLMYLTWHGQSHFVSSDTSTQLLLLAAGPITAIPLLLFAAAARRIPMATLGLMQYIAPSIQFLIGVWWFQEVFNQDKFIGFIAIWTGLLIYSLEGVLRAFKPTEPAAEN